MLHKRFSRGFTLVEMITSVAIIGLIMLLLGYEFDRSLEHLLHTRSNQNMESDARLAIRKVTNRLRTASPWFTSGSHVVILSPVPINPPGGTSTILQFYRVHPNSLANPATIPAPSGVPSPPYDLVTIQRSGCPSGCTDPSPNFLVETAIDTQTLQQSETPLVLARDVTNFSINAQGDPTAAQVEVTLTISSTSSRCTPKCSYTADNSVWVAGDNINGNE